jgi:hypothetical protein
MKFLNKLSTQSYNFFVKQENLVEYGKILLDIIKMDESIYLRERFSRETEHLIQQILSIYI